MGLLMTFEVSEASHNAEGRESQSAWREPYTKPPKARKSLKLLKAS